jgi:hypothetical protein
VKKLLDENLAHRLRRSLGAHEVFTVSYRGWAGLKNGELLRTAEEGGIEIFLTGDQTLVFEQNLNSRNLPSWCCPPWSGIICRRSLQLLIRPCLGPFKRSSAESSNAARSTKSEGVLRAQEHAG